MEETIQSMELAQNYKTVKENVTKACEQAGRSEQEVTLLAVSKTKPEFDKRNAETIAQQTGTKVVPINPLSYDWETEMLNVAKALTPMDPE